MSESDQEDHYSFSDFPYEDEPKYHENNAIKSIDKSWQFVSDMMKMLRDGSFNDVCIKLHDGEIRANKSVLAARCEYFAATFRWKSNNNHDEEEIVVNDCSKKIMTRIMKYLFSGVLKIDDLSLLELLQLEDQVRKLLPGDNLEKIIQEYIYNPKDYMTKDLREFTNFFPSNEEIVKSLSLVESGNLQMLDPEEIRGILELSRHSRGKIASLASFAHHGVIQEVSELSLCSNGYENHYHDPYGILDLGFVPGEHLQALVPCVTDFIKIKNVTGCDVTSLLDSINCTELHLTQKLNQDETDALVRAMATRVDDVSLGGPGVVMSLNVDTLTQYKGDGKCRAIHCIWNSQHWDEPAVEWITAETIETWARRMNWSVTKYMVRGANSNIHKICLKRTKDLNDAQLQAVDHDLSSLNLNN